MNLSLDQRVGADALVVAPGPTVPAPESLVFRGRTHPELSIVIPMFRESDRISRTIAVLAASSLHRPDVEFLFIDDGSGDATSSVTYRSIETHGLQRARVISLSQNIGKGGAVRAGVLSATGAVIGFLDADLSLDPAQVHRAWARLEATKGDVIVGHRRVDPSKQPKLRRIASLAFRSLVTRVAPTGVRDTQCAMKLFRAPVAWALFESLTVSGFAFDVEVLLRARRLGVEIDEVSIDWEHQPGSRLNTATASAQMMRQIVQIRRSLRIAG